MSGTEAVIAPGITSSIISGISAGISSMISSGAEAPVEAIISPVEEEEAARKVEVGHVFSQPLYLDIYVPFYLLI